MLFTQGLYAQNQSQDILNQGESAAKAILANLDTPPPNVKADHWAKLRPQLELLAHVIWAGSRCSARTGMRRRPSTKRL